MANALTSLQFDTRTEGLVLHQALHGYSEGHRLLESSIPIPDDLKRPMQRMSDLSGTSVINGFQEYLTGYPLFSLDAYALAKTWYAPEMPRPGCVWTHTFIIPASVMARIASFDAVRPLFRRPNGRFIRDAYSEPVILESEPSIREYERETDHRVKIRAFISAHYGKELRPLVIAAADSDEYADMILAAWSQKWPALRMSFTFCTGSLSARVFENRPLDVQCVPIFTARQVSREIAEGGDAILMDFASDRWPKWVTLAGNDAMQLSGGPVRSFLWSVAGTDSARADFEPFVKIYDCLHESTPLSNILEVTAELFPGPTDGRRLKKTLFGDQKISSIRRIEPEEVLVALATTDHYQSFNLEELSLREQATRVFTERPTAGCLLLGELFRDSLNPIGEEVLKALILAMGPEDALAFVADQQQFLPSLFRANAALATSAKLWRVAGVRKRELFDSLAAQPRLEPELVRGIIDALLESNSDAFIGRAFSQWGKVAVLQALDWIEGHDATITDPCPAALTSHIREVMAWVGTDREKSTAMLAAIAHIVAPYSSQIARHDSTVWVRTLRALRENRREDEANYVSAFVLALALCNAPPAPLDLVSESFERVHWLAEKELLRDDAWFILKPLVPELSWGRNWDWCERLRRALVSAFVRHSWPAWQLSERIKNRGLVEELLKSARKMDAEYYFRNV
jgi:hypothetical protein